MTMPRVIIVGLWLEKTLKNAEKTIEKDSVMRRLLAGFGIFFIIIYLYSKLNLIGIL